MIMNDALPLPLPLPVLPVGQYRACLSAKDTDLFSTYPGSAIRGAFGHALRKAVCVTRLERCDDCLLYRSCPYSYIFETPPPLTSRKMRLYEAAPHPFVFEVPFTFDAEPKTNCQEIGFNLFGRGNRFLPYVVYALEEAGKRGIGRKRIPLALDMVVQCTDWNSNEWKPIYRPSGSSPHQRVAGIHRNRRQHCRGISGRFGLEYAQACFRSQKA
jgi:hypothetical protein